MDRKIGGQTTIRGTTAPASTQRQSRRSRQVVFRQSGQFVFSGTVDVKPRTRPEPSPNPTNTCSARPSTYVAQAQADRRCAL
ncbi:hypothetical protein CPB84DRAFT_558108 [Gymnopilus junonius]|uniref:Uncharacterized protein n=1 Tax=Gymnopilus junonius TaxID=109634 RepID=A0A9P5N8N9_GYMJU|nr:hypothetical protein CPB84DRAFT_558108 [Gymnopilus junonius]